MADENLLFDDLPRYPLHLRHAERLLLAALPEHVAGRRGGRVNATDEAVCRRLQKRGLVAITLVNTHPDGRQMFASRLPTPTA